MYRLSTLDLQILRRKSMYVENVQAAGEAVFERPARAARNGIDIFTNGSVYFTRSTLFTYFNGEFPVGEGNGETLILFQESHGL